jgi:hypothetical protein
MKLRPAPEQGPMLCEIKASFLSRPFLLFYVPTALKLPSVSLIEYLTEYYEYSKVNE